MVDCGPAFELRCSAHHTQKYRDPYAPDGASQLGEPSPTTIIVAPGCTTMASDEGGKVSEIPLPYVLGHEPSPNEAPSRRLRSLAPPPTPELV